MNLEVYSIAEDSHRLGAEINLSSPTRCRQLVCHSNEKTGQDFCPAFDVASNKGVTPRNWGRCLPNTWSRVPPIIPDISMSSLAFRLHRPVSAACTFAKGTLPHTP